MGHQTGYRTAIRRTAVRAQRLLGIVRGRGGGRSIEGAPLKSPREPSHSTLPVSKGGLN